MAFKKTVFKLSNFTGPHQHWCGGLYRAMFVSHSLGIFDTIADGFLVDVKSDAMHSFHWSLLFCLTWGDLFRSLVHYVMFAIRRDSFYLFVYRAVGCDENAGLVIVIWLFHEGLQ